MILLLYIVFYLFIALVLACSDLDFGLLYFTVALLLFNTSLFLP